jgi:hypothetical protein
MSETNRLNSITGDVGVLACFLVFGSVSGLCRALRLRGVECTAAQPL